MPYIEKKEREKFDGFIKKLLDKEVLINNSGELNYIITNICLAYILQHGIHFSTINDIKGVLGTVWDIIHKRVLLPYEHDKKVKNGDLELYKMIEKILQD